MICFSVTIDQKVDFCKPFTAHVQIRCGGCGGVLHEVDVTDFADPVKQLADSLPLCRRWECGCELDDEGIGILGDIVKESKQMFLEEVGLN